MTAPDPRPSDPLATLRSYAALAPWNLRDLAGMAGAILDASGIYPLNAAARARPTERTIRFYVAQGLVTKPEGRGTAATYNYRHLLQVLGIKLRQMEGATLDKVAAEFQGLTGDVIERRVAGALGAALPPPDRLAVPSRDGAPRGRVGRALQFRAAEDAAAGDTGRFRGCRRLVVAPGVELLLDDAHPAARRDPAGVAEVVRNALSRLIEPPAPGQS
jgi:hypothetical protein